MARDRSEWLPFKCPSCGHAANRAIRVPQPLLVGLYPTYSCAACGSRSIPRNLYLALVIAAGLVFPAAALGLASLAAYLRIGVRASALGAVLLALALATLAFHLLARRLIVWRSVQGHPPGKANYVA
jgi:predicted RNA-binding Zn-ribbon protein involved in translation (DUF1610 family)